MLTSYRYLSADYERKVFNVSACVWNEGAKENIITITSKDANSTGGGGDSTSSKEANLSGGAIAGIVTGSVIGVILVVAALVIILLRKRRKWLDAGFRSAAGKNPTPEESVVNGPVMNSPSNSPAAYATSRSAPTRSTPPTVTSISATRSTAKDSLSPDYSNTGSTRFTINERGDGTSNTPELDGCDTQIDVQDMSKTAKRIQFYELPGS